MNTTASKSSNVRTRILVHGAIYGTGSRNKESAFRVHGKISPQHPVSMGMADMYLVSKADGTVQPLHRSFIRSANKQARFAFLSATKSPAKKISDFR